MIEIKTINDIYPAISEIITILEQKDNQRYICDVLKHRLYKVNWTTRSELFEELVSIFNNIIKDNSYVSNLDEAVINQINKILKIIKETEK